jgi:hypothetical protein
MKRSQKMSELVGEFGVGWLKSIFYHWKIFFISVEIFTVITFQILLTYVLICYIYPLPFSEKSCEMHKKSLPQPNSSPTTCTRSLSCTCVHKLKACKFKTFILIQLRESTVYFCTLTNTQQWCNMMTNIWSLFSLHMWSWTHPDVQLHWQEVLTRIWWY